MPPIIAFVAVTLGVSAAIATAIVVSVVVIAALALAILLLPKPNSISQTRLTDSLNVNAPRIMVFGKTAFGNDERYWEVYGSAGYDQIVCTATHRITSFGTFYIQGAPLSFSGDTCTGTGSVGTFGGAGYVSSTTNYAGGTLLKHNSLVGVHGTAFPGSGTTGAGSLWTANCSMTGLSGYRLKWNVTQKSLPSGIPTQFLQEGEGCPIYDPRRDTTVGGSGSHRANDNSTWEYLPTDSNGIPIGRNNALQMITYLLGWHIVNPSTSAYVPVAGRCVNPNDINYASFIAAANTCEAEHYYTDGAMSCADSHSNNESIIANGVQGYLLDPGGLWSYWVATNDTASIAVALSQSDIIGGVAWVPKDTISNLYNSVGGNFVDPSATNLYQPYPYPDVVDSTYLSQDGGISKVLKLDFQNVQDPNLAQKLARIALNRNRVTGQFTATFNYKALQAEMYNCVTLTFPNFGWTNKLFRVIGQAINPIGGIDLVLLEEFASIYTGGTVNTYAPAASGSTYDPLQQIALGALTLTTVNILSSGSFAYDGIEVTWTTVPANVASIEVQYKKATDATWIAIAPITFDVPAVVIQPVLPNTAYNIQARTISRNGVPGAWSTGNITTATFTTATQNQTFNQGTDPVLTQTINDGAIWSDPANNNLYMRIGGSWVIIGIITTTVAAGTVLFDSSVPSSFSFPVPAASTAQVDIEVWGGGGGGGHGHGGGGSGYSIKTSYAVTPGTTIISGAIGAGGLNYDATIPQVATSGSASTVTTPSLSAGGGGSGASAAGAGGTATGGTTNTAGEAGDVGATGNGGANLGTSGGARQTTSGANGNAPGGGGAYGPGFVAGAGANGRVRIIAR